MCVPISTCVHYTISVVLMNYMLNYICWVIGNNISLPFSNPFQAWVLMDVWKDVRGSECCYTVVISPVMALLPYHSSHSRLSVLYRGVRPFLKSPSNLSLSLSLALYLSLSLFPSPSVMASSLTSATPPWKVLQSSTFPACTAAPTCGVRQRRGGTITV